MQEEKNGMMSDEISNKNLKKAEKEFHIFRLKISIIEIRYNIIKMGSSCSYQIAIFYDVQNAFL